MTASTADNKFDIKIQFNIIKSQSLIKNRDLSAVLKNDH